MAAIGKCIDCGTNFVKPPEQAPAVDARCNYCETARLRERIAELEMALQLPLLFHGGGPWDDARANTWNAITGGYEATTSAMCLHIRKVIARTKEESRG